MSEIKVITGRPREMAEDLVSLGITHADIIHIDNDTTGPRYYVWYVDHDGKSPAELLKDVVADGSGTPIMTSHWPKIRLVYEKTGVGTVTLTIEGRLRGSSNWYTLKDSAGADITFAIGGGAQKATAYVDSAAWYELRATLSSTAGAVSVSCYAAGGE